MGLPPDSSRLLGINWKHVNDRILGKTQRHLPNQKTRFLQGILLLNIHFSTHKGKSSEDCIRGKGGLVDGSPTSCALRWKKGRQPHVRMFSLGLHCILILTLPMNILRSCICRARAHWQVQEGTLQHTGWQRKSQIGQVIPLTCVLAQCPFIRSPRGRCLLRSQTQKSSPSPRKQALVYMRRQGPSD